MSVALSNPPATGVIQAEEMTDGQLGVIVGGCDDGRVVQLIGESASSGTRLQPVGLRGGKGWSQPLPKSLRIRPLKAGETLTVTDN